MVCIIKQSSSAFYSHLTNSYVHTQFFRQELQCTAKTRALRVSRQPTSRMALVNLQSIEHKEKKSLEAFKGNEFLLTKEQRHRHQTSHPQHQMQFRMFIYRGNVFKDLMNLCRLVREQHCFKSIRLHCSRGPKIRTLIL